MRRHPALLILCLLLTAFAGASAWAQDIEKVNPGLEPYVPPPMFGPASAAAPVSTPSSTDVISFPIKTETKTNSVNPSTGTAVQSEALPPPADAPALTEAAKKVTKVRKAPPIPPQRPATLVASEAYIAEQKRVEEEAAAKKISEELAAKKALDEEVAQKKAAAEAQARAEIDAAKLAEAEAEKAKAAIEAAQVKVEAIPESTEHDKPAEAPASSPPPLPVQSKLVAPQTLMGAELANPSVEEILENLDGKPVPAPVPKTAIPQGPVNPYERMIMVRSSQDTGPSVRIHAKRPAKKKETAHSFFIVFEPNASDVTELGQQNFDKKIVPLLNENADLYVQIQAYAKSVGKNDAEAQRISLARANSIRTYFLEKNIAPERIQIHALGAQATGGAQDRVDIILLREIAPIKVQPKPHNTAPEAPPAVTVPVYTPIVPATAPKAKTVAPVVAPKADSGDLTTPAPAPVVPAVNKAPESPAKP